MHRLRGTDAQRALDTIAKRLWRPIGVVEMRVLPWLGAISIVFDQNHFCKPPHSMRFRIEKVRLVS